MLDVKSTVLYKDVEIFLIILLGKGEFVRHRLLQLEMVKTPSAVHMYGEVRPYIQLSELARAVARNASEILHAFRKF